MYVELLLSAVAVIVWWHTEPGWLHDAALSVFLVTNVSTLAFNLNPLLRLDGYYLLCDWLDTPNLRQRATAVLTRMLAWRLAGVRLPRVPGVPRADHGWLVAYAVGSTLYRWSFLLLVTFSLHAMLKPYGLGSLGLALGATAAVVGAVQACWGVAKFCREHHRRLAGAPRVRITVAAAAASAAWFFFAPLPLSVEAPMVVQPRDPQAVYVTTPGRLTKALVSPGDRVTAGQLLAVLENPDERDRYRQLHTVNRSLGVEVAVHRAAGDAAAASRAEQTHQAVYQEALDQRDRLKRLALRAPCAGVVVEPAERNRRTGGDRLPTWLGGPLDAANRGAFLQRGTHLLSVDSGSGCDALLLIPQPVRDDFPPGAEVRLQAAGYPGVTLRGMVADAASWITEPADPARGAAESGLFQARVALPADAPRLLAGTTGRGRVWVTHRSAAQWLWRQVRTTFHHRW